jgi:hypothetical protein
MTVPYTFGTATSSIPLTQLDSNFATAITLGSTNVYLGNTTTTLVGFANLSSTLITSPTHNSGTTLSLQTGGTTGLYIDASQNVGIGTSSPRSSAGFKTLAIDASTTPILDLFVAGTRTATFSATSASVNLTAVTAVPLIFNTNNTEVARIDSSGNVGIGTSSPAVKLQIGSSSTSTQSENIDMWGTLAGSNGDIGRLRFYNVNAFGNKIVAQVSGARDGNNYGGALLFSTGTQADTTLTERVRIDSSGNVGIGTSAASASAILDAQSTTKGVRFPNMTTTQKNAISSPAAGLVVFDTTLAKLCVYTGAAWQTVTSI